MSSEKVKDKYGNILQLGDTVSGPFLSNKKAMGQIDAIVIDPEHAQRDGISNPPKVIFTDKQGKREIHNPESLEKLEDAEQASPYKVPKV